MWSRPSSVRREHRAFMLRREIDRVKLLEELSL